MDVTTYLQRLDYHSPLEPSAETLRGLHRAHMMTVPFENLDIWLGRPIVLDEAALYDKVARRRRGGFCYELNGLFAALLRALGFDVTLLSARAHGGPEFDHMALLVQLEQRWLADVGFGDSFVEPLLLDERGEQIRNGQGYRISTDGDEWRMAARGEGGEWADEFAFTLQPRQPGDYAGMCHYHQTSPQSMFTQKRICSRATPDGRISLSNRQLIITRNGRRQERELATDDDCTAALREHFGIVLEG
ncbi:MAG: arylamine N-acetyltransferase [Chloroflexi bacterium]|nr:arylamine N-acetyltransferase [Chloroflexota bacterium]